MWNITPLSPLSLTDPKDRYTLQCMPGFSGIVL
jgi:hypothetical protein